MAKREHLILDAWDCNNDKLSDENEIESILKYLAELTEAIILEGPVIARREDRLEGLTGIIITNKSHITIHTFPSISEATVEFYSYTPLDKNQIMNDVILFLEVDHNSIKVISASDRRQMAIECEEPNCSRPAEREWKGRKLCQDHYEFYTERRNQFMSTDDSY